MNTITDLVASNMKTLSKNLGLTFLDTGLSRFIDFLKKYNDVLRDVNIFFYTFKQMYQIK